MTIKKFLENCENYFGAFNNKMVVDILAYELKFVKPADMKRVFRELITIVPANWKPDYKSLKEAIKRSGIELLPEAREERICPVCETRRYTNSCCPVCKYDNGDGDPEEYKKFWEEWKAGEINKTDTAKVIKRLAAAKRMKEKA